MSDFANQLIVWQPQQGRHGLPWQAGRDPYRVWLSEIMLQQTRVTTVIPYFERFVARFPDLDRLAVASLDEVLQYWSGLGYYSRARNLHAAARLIVTMHGSAFPRDPNTLIQLPGIGRSTAAAIAAFCFDTRAAILDGNVKRVLTRHFGIAEYPGERQTEIRLWSLAESLLPVRQIAIYTQALMDLGAMVCTRSHPDCSACPVTDTCFARRTGQTGRLPAPKPRKALPQLGVWLVAYRYGQRLWLTRRPTHGIWGGLWCLPEYPAAPDAPQLCRQQWGVAATEVRTGNVFRHTLTHRRLDIVPVWVDLAEPPREDAGGRWVSRQEALAAGIPVAVRKILQEEFTV